MAEIIDFEGFKNKRKEEDGGERPKNTESVEKRRRIWFRLEGWQQDALTALMRGVATMKPPPSEDKIEEQHVIVRAWSDDEVLEFCKTQSNLEILKTKPALVVAVLGRIIEETQVP